MSAEATRAAVIDAAREVFLELGHRATSVASVARRAGVSRRTVRRVVGDSDDLLAAVLESTDDSEAAQIVGRAARSPGVTPPMATFVAAAHAVFREPEASWDPATLQALARAREDEDLRAAAGHQVASRSANTAAVVAQSRADEGIDPALADNAIVHLSMAMSIGLAMLDPVATHRPSPGEWDALMARIGTAIAPDEMQLASRETSRMWRIRVDLPDQPGALAHLVRALGALHVVSVGLVVVGGGHGSSTTDLALVAPATVSKEVILAAARSAGVNAHITETPAAAAGDLPTQMLDAATSLVKDPESAPQIAAGLVEADSVEVIDATEGVDDRSDVLRLQWTADRHVVLRRSWAPFALAEQTRASALLRLAAAIARRAGHDQASSWIEPVAGSTIWIRLARPEDAQGVARMHDRCSEQSRYQRYFSLIDWRDVQLRRLAGGHRGASLVAMARSGNIVALGNVFPADDVPGAGEIAVIVEDAHQGTGVGSAMLRRLLQTARRIGFRQVVAHVLAENAGMRRLLDGTGLTWSSTAAEGVLTLTADLAAPAEPQGSLGPALP